MNNAAEQLKKLQQAHEQIDSVLNTLNSVLYISPECKLYNAIWQLASLAEDSIAENIGISQEALNWFIHENDFGKKNLSASSDTKKDFIISSIDTFLEFEMEHG